MLLLASCASNASVASGLVRPKSIQVVYRPEVMFYVVEDGGQGRFRVNEREDYVFPSSHAVYSRVAALLMPLKTNGNTCPGRPVVDAPGFIRWTLGAVSHEVPLDVSGCDDEAFVRRYASSERAFQYVSDIAEHAPQPGHAPLSAPTEIKLVWMSWGSIREEWTVPAGGLGHWRDPDSGEKNFTVSQSEFDRVRDQFRAFEGMAFRCDRVIYDLPYGRIVWSQQGFPDQTLDFDLGCVTGDADAVLERVRAATVLLVEMRDRGS